MTTLSMELPDQIFSVMRYAPEDFKKEMRLAAAAVWYEQGRVSQEMAAKIAGMNRTDFLLALARMEAIKVSVKILLRLKGESKSAG